jgi:hypothetical protein
MKTTSCVELVLVEEVVEIVVIMVVEMVWIIVAWDSLVAW